MIRERGEPAIADTSKPILEAPVVPEYPSNPTVPTADIPREEEEDPDVVAARTDYPSPYNDNEEIIDTGDDDDDSEIFNRNGVVVGDDEEDLVDDDDEDDDIS